MPHTSDIPKPIVRKNPMPTHAPTKTCSRCHKTVTSGYAITHANQAVCYACCASLDTKSLLTTGHSKNLPLYLNTNTVTNWPGSLVIPIVRIKTSKHNMGLTRTDVWFNVPGDPYLWHGFQIGNFTSIVHCQRTKQKK